MDCLDRRKDASRRKAISEMTLEDAIRELLTSDVTGLPNRRAFDDAERIPAPVIAMCDVDGLKALNDTYGYAAGNALLAAMGDALMGAGLDCYHDKGDEFLVRGESCAKVEDALYKALAELSSTIPGAAFSFGVGQDLYAAEWAMKAHKHAREERGERGRGKLCGMAQNMYCT